MPLDRAAAALFAALFVLATLVSRSNGLPDGFSDEFLMVGEKQPISMRYLPDGRMLILERLGRMLIVDDQFQPQAYMHVTNIPVDVEKGLLDFALDPDFEQTSQFYVYYTPAVPERVRISAFTHMEYDGGLTSRGDVTSEVIVWEEPEYDTGYFSCCHFGSMLEFGPDGYLYVATGDMFNGSSSQDLHRARGKVLRIDTQGRAPDDNFGVLADGRGGHVLDEIYAYGLRNPFRGRWDEEQGLLIAEVGGNNQAISQEDLHRLEPGANFGWPLCEGLCDNPNFPLCNCQKHKSAIYTYAHLGLGKSITGGIVYRGSMFPKDPYYGAYFFGDYAEGWLKYGLFDSDGNLGGITLFSSFTPGVIFITASPSGELIYFNVYGEVRRIVFSSGNGAPVVNDISASPASGMAPLEVSFEVDAADPEEEEMTFEWSFGDGIKKTVDNSNVVIHTYQQDGSYPVMVTVSDGHRAIRSDVLTVNVGPAPNAVIEEPKDGDIFVAGQNIAFRGHASLNNQPMDETRLSWRIRFKHDDHFHPVLDGLVGSQGQVHADDSGHSYVGDTGFYLDLRATAPSGVSTSVTVRIYPKKVPLTVVTQPEGLVISLDGIPRPTPFVEDTAAAFKHRLSGDTLQCLDGVLYTFESWLPDEHSFIDREYKVPEDPTTVMAIFERSGECGLPVLTGLVLHLDAAKGVSVDAEGLVVRWQDQAGTNDLTTVDLMQGAAPSLLDGISGMKALAFDGNLQGLGRDTFSGLPLANEPRSMFMVAEYSSPGWGGFSYGRIGCVELLGLGITPKGNSFVETFCTADETQSGIDLVESAGTVVQGLTFDGSVMRHFIDGELVSENVEVINTKQGTIRLGVDHSLGNKLQMKVAEILIYDRHLSDADVASLHDYFHQKYFKKHQPDTSKTTVPPGAVALDMSIPENGTTMIVPSQLLVSWTVVSGVEMLNENLMFVISIDNQDYTVSAWDERNAFVVISSDDEAPWGDLPSVHSVSVSVRTVADGIVLASVKHFLNIVAPEPTPGPALSTPQQDADSGPPSVEIVSPSMHSVFVTGQPVVVTWMTFGNLTGFDRIDIVIDNSAEVVVVTDPTSSHTFYHLQPGPHTITVDLQPFVPEVRASVIIGVVDPEPETTTATESLPSSTPGSTTAISSETTTVQSFPTASATTGDSLSTSTTSASASVTPSATETSPQGEPIVNDYRLVHQGKTQTNPFPSLHRRFATAFSDHSYRAFGPVRATLSSCASHCNADDSCRGLVVWNTPSPTPITLCIGLRELGPPEGVPTEMDSYSYAKIEGSDSETGGPTLTPTSQQALDGAAQPLALCVGGRNSHTRMACLCPQGCVACALSAQLSPDSNAVGDCLLCAAPAALYGGTCWADCPQGFVKAASSSVQGVSYECVVEAPSLSASLDDPPSLPSQREQCVLGRNVETGEQCSCASGCLACMLNDEAGQGPCLRCTQHRHLFADSCWKKCPSHEVTMAGIDAFGTFCIAKP